MQTNELALKRMNSICKRMNLHQTEELAKETKKAASQMDELDMRQLMNPICTAHE